MKTRTIKWLAAVIIAGGIAGCASPAPSGAGSRRTAEPPRAAAQTVPPAARPSPVTRPSDERKPTAPPKQPPGVEWGPVQLEAFAICRKGEKSGKWWCDGPGQNLSTSDYPTVKHALDMVGCWPAISAAGARTKDGRSVDLYRCGYGLRSHERNIAKIHGIVTAPRSYMCRKNYSAKCTEFFSGQNQR